MHLSQQDGKNALFVILASEARPESVSHRAVRFRSSRNDGAIVLKSNDT